MTIRQTGTAAEDARADELGRERRKRLRALIEAKSPRALRELELATEDPHPLVRAEAAYQLAHTHHPKAHELLGKLTSDPRPVVRISVVEAIAELGAADAAPRIAAFAVADRSEDVRGAAARALGALGGPDAERGLEVLASDEVPVVREEATEALARIRGNAGGAH